MLRVGELGRLGALVLIISAGTLVPLIRLFAFDAYDLQHARVRVAQSAGAGSGSFEPDGSDRGSFSAASRGSQRSAQWIRSDPETSHFIDEHGRVRLFHGLNVVFKTPPHVPDPGDWTAGTSFGPADAANLSAWGFNAIRLGVLWAGTFPAQRGVPDPGYMATVKQIVLTCEAHGIHVVLDMHSDVHSWRFCGNGMPDWAVDDALHESGMRPPYGDFPAPLQLEQAHFFKAAPEPAGGGAPTDACGLGGNERHRTGRRGLEAQAGAGAAQPGRGSFSNRSSAATSLGRSAAHVSSLPARLGGWCSARLAAAAAATTSSEVAAALEAAGLYPKLEACLERDFFQYYSTNVSTRTTQVDNGSRAPFLSLLFCLFLSNPRQLPCGIVELTYFYGLPDSGPVVLFLLRGRSVYPFPLFHLRRGHPPGRGRWHAPSSRHL